LSLSLYRKYRPETFLDMMGQEHIATTLKNAVKTNQVSHAYLFCGPRGTGKTTTARLLAKALLCDNAPTDQPCSACLACREIADGMHPDVYELDAASRTGVENVREEIIGRVQFSPTRGSYKIYIIDEVHMLSTAAFNALLKTLEEPPSHVKFILCTTDPHKVPSTIQSRCQRFDFHRLSESQITERLLYICKAEGYQVEPEALNLIAQRSFGGMRDAIGSLEQIAVFARGNITYLAAESMLGEVSAEQMFSLAALIAERNVAACFAWVASFTQSGTDIAQFVRDLSHHLRNLYIASVLGNDPSLPELLETDREQSRRYLEQAKLFGSVDRLADALVVLGDLSSQLRFSANARLAFEIALTRMARPDADLTLESLAARIAILEGQWAKNPPAGRFLADDRPERPSVGQDSSEQPEKTPSLAEQAPAEQVPAGKAPAEQALAEQISAGQIPVEQVPAEHISKEQVPMEQPTTIFVVAEQTQEEFSDSSDLTASEELTADVARRLLLQVDKELTKAKKTSILLFLGGASARPDPKTSGLLIELPSGASFNKQNLERPENREILDSLVKKLYGRSLPISYVLGKPKPEAEKPRPEVEKLGQMVEKPKPEAEKPKLENEMLWVEAEKPAQLAEEPKPEAEEPRQEAERSKPEPSHSETGSRSFDEILSASFGASIFFDEVTTELSDDKNHR